MTFWILVAVAWTVLIALFVALFGYLRVDRPLKARYRELQFDEYLRRTEAEHERWLDEVEREEPDDR